MARYRITTPVGDYAGVSAGVSFSGGQAEVTDPAPGALLYFRNAGYHVERLDTVATTQPAGRATRARRAAAARAAKTTRG